MELIKKKTVDRLTTDSVSVLTQQFVDLNGVSTQVGENHRTSYANSESGRSSLQDTEPDEVVNAVLAIWGDTPTVEESQEVVDAETSEVGQEVN